MRWLTLEKVEKSSYFQILLEEWQWDLFPETRFEDSLFIPFVKYPHLENRQALAVQLFNRAWLRRRMTFARARHIVFLVCVNNPLVLTVGVKFGQSEGIPDSGYRHELFKINFTGVPSSSSPDSPRFFPLFRSISFSLALHYLNAWNRLLYGHLSCMPETLLWLETTPLCKQDDLV